MHIETAAIACVDLNWGLGKNNTIPWKNKEDMKFFKETTRDSILVMGRITYESIKKVSKPNEFLPGRVSVIISNTIHVLDDTTLNVFSVNNLNQAKHFIDGYNAGSVNKKNVFFIGGRNIYLASLPFINKLYLNMILEEYNCDVNFPKELLENFSHEKSIQLSDKLISHEYVKV